MELVLPMHNAHPYFSLKNLGKKSAHYTQQNTACCYFGRSYSRRHLEYIHWFSKHYFAFN